MRTHREVKAEHMPRPFTIMRKKIDPRRSTVLYDDPVGEKMFLSDWKICGGEWKVEGEWITGRNPGNCPGMIVSRFDYPGDVMVEFDARTVPPCTHDIDFMWNGSWDERNNRRGLAYVAGLEGWWEGKAGIEKSPEYKLNAGTALFDFQPGRVYRILGGSVGGHCFLVVDGKLILEVTDPDPIDSDRNAKVGFEAYCSHIQIKNIRIMRIAWEPFEMTYSPEFR